MFRDCMPKSIVTGAVQRPQLKWSCLSKKKKRRIYVSCTFAYVTGVIREGIQCFSNPGTGSVCWAEGRGGRRGIVSFTHDPSPYPSMV